MAEPPPRIHLRPATEEDCQHLWEWRNDPAAREASLNTDPIDYQYHRRWFASRIQDPGTSILIVLDDRDRKIGYVRFNISGGEAEISVTVETAVRGKGYGPAAICQGSEHMLARDSIRRIVAHVKASNHASLKAFRKAGFVDDGIQQMDGIPFHRMTYKGSPTWATRARHSPQHPTQRP